MSEENWMQDVTEEGLLRKSNANLAELIATGVSQSACFTVAPTYFLPQITLICAKTKKSFKYDPRPNPTNIELARLLELFTYVAASNGAMVFVDVDSYVAKYELTRHFQIT